MKGATAGLSGLAALVLLLPMEAGVPVPLPADALPALILGSSVFLQFHLVLGLLLGPLADRAFDQAKGPALAALGVLAAGTVAFWLVRRRRRAASAMWMEATCPVCIGASLLAERVPALTGLTGSGPADAQMPGDAQTPGKAQQSADAQNAPKTVMG
jgi:hypothetical protein